MPSDSPEEMQEEGNVFANISESCEDYLKRLYLKVSDCCLSEEAWKIRIIRSLMLTKNSARRERLQWKKNHSLNSLFHFLDLFSCQTRFHNYTVTMTHLSALQKVFIMRDVENVPF